MFFILCQRSISSIQRGIRVGKEVKANDMKALMQKHLQKTRQRIRIA